MEVKAVIHEKYEDMELHVCNHALNDEVSQMVNTLSELVNKTYIVKNERGDSQLIAEKDLLLIYAESQRVFLKTAAGTFQSAQKLYELEEQLDSSRFLRISRAEIINIKKIKRLDFGSAGTIKVILSDGSECYTSRRSITKLKAALGI